MKAPTTAAHRAAVEGAAAFIRRHIREPFAEEDVAEAVGYSRVHLRRVFRSVRGEALGAYIRRIRIEAACGRLSMGDEPIERIAHDAGFNEKAFSRAVHQEYRLAPTDFRRENAGPEHALAGSYIWWDTAPPSRMEIGLVDDRGRTFTVSYAGDSPVGTLYHDGRFEPGSPCPECAPGQADCGYPFTPVYGGS